MLTDRGRAIGAFDRTYGFSYESSPYSMAEFKTRSGFGPPVLVSWRTVGPHPYGLRSAQPPRRYLAEDRLRLPQYLLQESGQERGGAADSV